VYTIATKLNQEQQKYVKIAAINAFSANERDLAMELLRTVGITCAQAEGIEALRRKNESNEYVQITC
jgi:hypothetical protein